MTGKFIFIRQFITLTIIFSSVLSVFGQTRRAVPQAKTPAASKQTTQKCVGGWSGVVTFKKVLKESNESDERGIRKSIDRIKRKTSRNYEYAGRAVVDGSNPQNPQVSTKVDFSDKDLSWGEERVFDTCNARESGHWFIIEGTDDRTTEAKVSGPAQYFGLNVNEAAGTYDFNLAFPDTNSTEKREVHSRRSGHCQARNNEPYDSSTNEPVKIKGESFSIRNQKFDPNNPDRLSGTKTWGDDGTGAVRTFIFQATWRFTRCPQKLLITDVRFEHPKFPNWDDWQEIGDAGTIDGNPIKIKAKVLNLSAETKFAEVTFNETYKGDSWNSARPDQPLRNSDVSVRLEPGEEREVEIEWDSEGYAWYEDGRPRTQQRIKVEAREENKVKDEMTKALKIAPKPLVLVHGIWETYKVWEPLYQNLLTETHSYDWKAYLVGEHIEHGLMNMGSVIFSKNKASSVYDNADQLAKYVRYAQEDRNAWHVDMVAHSTGGLVARLYVHKQMPIVLDGRPQVKHLLMLGTPNNGAPCIDDFYSRISLFKENFEAAKELRSEEIARFNEFVVNRKGTKFAALVGNPVPATCSTYEWNDGFVTVSSAKHGIEDFAYSNDLNPRLVDGRNFENFVKPHIITGPNGKYPYPVKSDPNDIDRWKIDQGLFDSFENNFVNVSYGTRLTTGSKPQNFSKELKLAPKETVEIEMPVEAAGNLGVTFIANPSVAVSLINEKGLTVSKSAANSPPAGALFRALLTKTAVSKGVWKLTIENTSGEEQFFAGFSWSVATAAKMPVAE